METLKMSCFHWNKLCPVFRYLWYCKATCEDELRPSRSYRCKNKKSRFIWNEWMCFPLDLKTQCPGIFTPGSEDTDRKHTSVNRIRQKASGKGTCFILKGWRIILNKLHCSGKGENLLAEHLVDWVNIAIKGEREKIITHFALKQVVKKKIH